MSGTSTPFLAPAIAAFFLILACTPTNAAHRGGGSSFDGTWSVAIYTLRGDCGSVRVAAQLRVWVRSSDAISLSSVRSFFSSPRERWRHSQVVTLKSVKASPLLSFILNRPEFSDFDSRPIITFPGKCCRAKPMIGRTIGKLGDRIKSFDPQGSDP